MKKKIFALFAVLGTAAVMLSSCCCDYRDPCCDPCPRPCQPRYCPKPCPPQPYCPPQACPCPQEGGMY